MILRCAALGAFLFLAFAQQPDIDRAFAEYERAWSNADKDGVSRLASDDLIWITRGGRVLNKQEFIEVFNPKIGMKNIRDKKVRLFGDVAVLTYAADEGSSAIRRSIVWNKTPEGWKMVSAQATTIQQ
jgi:ketosteroid isomerase-like protein